MTDHLLQKIEERMATLLSAFENLRYENHKLKQENAALKTEQANHAKKLQGLASMLDAMATTSEEQYATA